MVGLLDESALLEGLYNDLEGGGVDEVCEKQSLAHFLSGTVSLRGFVGWDGVHE